MASNELLLRLTEQAVEGCVDPVRYQEMRKAYDALMAQPDVLGVGGGNKGITLSQWGSIVAAHLTDRCADELSVPYLSPERIVAWLRSLDDDFDAVLDWTTVHRSLAAASVRRRFPPTYQHKLATHRWTGTSITACVWAERCGRMLAIIDDDPCVHVFNAAGEADATWSGHGAAPLAIAHCPENDLTVSTACDRSVIVWDTKRGSPAQRVLLEEPATCVHVDAASGKILLATTDGRVALVSAPALPLAHEARGSMLGTAPAQPRRGAAGPSGVGASASPNLGASNPAFGDRRHRDWVTTATSCRLKGLVATGSRDRTIMVWRADTAAFVRRLVGHARAVQCLECVQRLATLVSSEVGTGNIYIWPLTSASDTPSRRLGHEADMVSVHVDPFGEAIVAIEVTMRVSVWDSGRLTLSHSTDVAESTKPPSGLRCAQMAPCSRTVMAVSGTHLVNFLPKPYDSTPTALGRQVLRLYLDAATFTVVVVTTGTVLFVNGVDAAIIREIPAPFGRRAPVESCTIAGGTAFLSSRRVTVAVSIRDALAGGNLRRVTGVSHAERVAGISRGGGPKSWIFVLGSGAVHIGKLRREATQYVFERSSQLSAPSVDQLGTPHGHVSPSSKMRRPADGATPAAGVTAAVAHCSFWRDDVEMEPARDEAEPGDARRDHTVGLIVYDSVPGCDSPVAALNTRTLARATSALPSRDGFVDATYLQRRGALVVLHRTCIAVYSAWNFHRIAEISGLSAVIGGVPTSIAYAGGDSAILGGPREGVGLVDLRGALDHFFANVAPSALAGVSTSGAASLPSASPSAADDLAVAATDGAARSSGPSRPREGAPMVVDPNSGLARFVPAPHPPPAHGFSATVVHAVDRASSAEIALKIHDLSSTLRAEVAIRRGLGSGVDRYVVRFEGSWGAEESDGLTVPKRKVPLPAAGSSPQRKSSVLSVTNDSEAATDAAAPASPVEPSSLADSIAAADAAVALLCINPPRDASQRREDRLRTLPRGIVMERCGTTLASAVSESAWPTEQRCRVIHHLLSACSAVFSVGFVHTELRPRHVIRASEGWKFCGVDAILPLGAPVRSPLSLGRHCPPEWVRQTRAGENPQATEAAAVWALGCLAFEVACQKPLFTGRSETAVLDDIAAMTDVLLSLKLGGVPGEVRGFVTRALKVDARQRPTLAELEAELEEQHLMAFPDGTLQGDRRSPVASPAASPTDPAGTRRRDGSPARPEPRRLAVVPTTIGAGAIATATDAASCVTVLRHKSLLGPVVSVATCPDSSLILLADTDSSHPSGGCVHLASFDAAAEQQQGAKELGFHGSMPPLEVGVPTAEGRWGAPLPLLSSTARRGIGAASSTPTGGAGGPADRDGDEAGCLADALVALAPVLPRDAIHDEVLRMWEGVSQSDVDAMLQAGQSGQELTEREVLFAFEQQVAKRSRFYDDTGAKRRPGEQLVLYAPQTKTRLTQLEMARVLASKAEHQHARSRIRLAKVLADAAQGSGIPDGSDSRKHKLDPEFVRRVPAVATQQDGAHGLFGGPRDDPDGTLLLQALVPVTERDLMRAPKPDPTSIRRQARVAYNVEVARNPDTEAWVERELERLSPTRTRGAGRRGPTPPTPSPDAS